MTHRHHQQQHHLDGMRYAIAGYAIITVFDVILKLVSKQGYPQLQMMATVGAFCAVTVALVALCKGGLHRLATQKAKFQILRGLIGLVAFLCGFYALRAIPLVDFYGIIFAIPILITLLSVFWLKEHVGRARWVAVGCGFIGVTIMLRAGTTQAATAAEHWGYFAALACALFNAVATVMVRRYGRQESNLTFSFYAALCNLAVTGSACLWLGQWQPYTPVDWGLMALAGVLVGISSIFLMTAYQHSPPAAIVPFQYTQLIWGAIYGYLLFQDIPAFWSMVGAGIVIASGWVVLWREARLARALKKALHLSQE